MAGADARRGEQSVLYEGRGVSTNSGTLASLLPIALELASASALVSAAVPSPSRSRMSSVRSRSSNRRTSRLSMSRASSRARCRRVRAWPVLPRSSRRSALSTCHGERAARVGMQGGDCADERGLACAVAAQQGGDLAFLGGHVEAVECGLLPVADDQALSTDDIGLGSSVSSLLGSGAADVHAVHSCVVVGVWSARSLPSGSVKRIVVAQGICSTSSGKSTPRVRNT